MLMEVRRSTCIFIVLIILIGMPTSYGQNKPVFQNFMTYTHAELQSNNLYGTVKDKQNNLWIATSEGLHYFDGKHFKRFDDGKQLKCIFYDSQQNIWTGSFYNGLYKWDTKTGTVKHYKSDHSDPNSLVNNDINCLYEDNHGLIWIGTGEGISILNPETDTFTNLQDQWPNEGLWGKTILTFHQDNHDRMWIGSWERGLTYTNELPKNGDFSKVTFSHICNESESKKRIGSNHIWKIVEDPFGYLWISTYSAGITLIKPSLELTPGTINIPTYQIIEPGKSNNFTSFYVNDIVFDRNSNVWIGTTDGLNFVSSHTFHNLIKEIETKDNFRSTLASTPIYPEAYNSNSLRDAQIRDIMEDDDGLLWFSTARGLSLYDPAILANFFRYLSPIKGVQIREINCFAHYDSTSLLLGTGNMGIVHYNKLDQTYKPFFPDKISANKIYFIEPVTETQKIWIGSSQGLYIFDPISTESVHVPLSKKVSSGDPINSILSFVRDQNGNVWLATGSGVVYINPIDLNYKVVGLKDEQSNSMGLSDLSVTDIAVDKNGDIWVATYSWLNKIVLNDKADISTIIQYKYHKEDPFSLDCKRIRTLTTDRDFNLWIGTETGIFQYKFKSGHFEKKVKSKNTADVYVTDLIADASGAIWATTSDGLQVYNPNNNTFKTYNGSNGLTNSTFRENSAFLDHDGTLNFGLSDGFLRFNPANISVEPKNSIHISDVQVLGKSIIDFSNFHLPDAIRLHSRENYFSIWYSNRDYRNASDANFSYKLEGYDEKWTHATDQNFAHYTNVRPGNYQFLVRREAQSISSADMATLHIYIKPLFWNTIWFKILIGCSVLAGVIIWHAFKRHQYKMIKKVLSTQVAERTAQLKANKIQIESLLQTTRSHNAQLEKKVKERTENLEKVNKEISRSNADLASFAYAASHDLIEPLRTVSSFLPILEEQIERDDKTMVKTSIKYIKSGVSSMESMIRGLLSYSRINAANANFKKDQNLYEIVNEKVQGLDALLHQKNAKISVDKSLPRMDCDPIQIGGLFHNLISNAIKFNNSDSCEVRIYLVDTDENLFTVCVQDNGIGIEKEYFDRIFEVFKKLNPRSEFAGSGIGLSLCRKYVETHGGNIWVESEFGKGSSFYIQLPYKKKMSNKDMASKNTRYDKTA